MRKLSHFGVAVVTALALPAAALAQALDPSGLRELDDDRTDLTYESLTVDQIDDLDVVRDGEVIGEIEEVLGNAQDEIVAVVIEYEDGFLGLNDTEVIMPIDRLEFGGATGQVATAMSDDELKALPVWDD